MSVLVALLFSVASSVLPTDASRQARADDAWAVDRDGVWDDPANWLGVTVPDEVGAQALFGPVITASRTVTIQDVTNGHGNDDGAITVGEINFNSGHSYSVGGLSGVLTLDNSDLPAVVRASSTSGYVPQFLSPQQIRLEDDLVVDSDIAGGVVMLNVVAADRTVTKLGRGSASFNPVAMNSLAGMSYNILEGRFHSDHLGRNVQNVLLNGGTLDLESRGFGPRIDGPLEIGDDGGVLDVIGGPSNIPGRMVINNEDRLRGDGRLVKIGRGALSIEGPQPNYRGPIEVAEGSLLLSRSFAHPLPNVPSIAVGRDATAYRASISIGSHDYSTTSISIGPGSELIGSHAAGLGLASLVRGGNLTLAENAVVAQPLAGGNESIGNLGAAAELYFGIAARQLDALNLTVGAGTPWKGISGSSLDRSQIDSATIVANSDFTIQHRGWSLTFGSDGGAGAVNIVSSGPRRTVTIADDALSYTSQPEAVTLLGDGSDLSGVGKFIVAPQARLHLLGSNMLGRGTNQIPAVELHGDTALRATGFGARDEAARIDILGGTTIELVHTGPGDVDFGGDFVVSHPAGVWFNASSLNASNDVASYRIGSLRFTTDSEVKFTAHNGKQTVIAGPIDLGNFDVLLNALGGSFAGNLPTLEGPLLGSGTLRVAGFTGAGVSLDNDLSGFRGPESRVVVSSGVLRLGDESMFDLGPDGPQIELWDACNPGVLSFAVDADLGARLTPDSTGVLALRGTHTALTGVNGSYAFLGANGTASFEGPTLQPGAENAYRLGGGVPRSELTLGSDATPNVLSGDNAVIVGPSSGPTDNLVEFAGANNYTGPTLVQSGTLRLTRRGAIGDGVVAGPIDVSQSVLEIRGQGTIGATGPITLRHSGALRLLSDGAAALDRIPDATPIVLRNGTISFQGDGGAVRPSEAIGSNGLALAEGHNTIEVSGGDAGARLEIGNVVRGGRATVAFAGVTEAIAPGAEPKEQILVGNGNALLANGIIPWAVVHDPSSTWEGFAGHGPTGVVEYSGPFVTVLDEAGPNDNVSPHASSASLSENTTINALQVNNSPIDLTGHVLNVGTAPLGGVAIGALIGNGSIGTGENPGFLTAGQSAFAPDSAFPGELIFHKEAYVNSMTINASIIDNAGPDGVLGNADDLPVAVTVAGFTTLNGSDNRYTGGTTVQGYLTANQALGPGPVHLEGGTLHLINETVGARMAAGPVTMNGGMLLGEAPGPSFANPGDVRVRSLTIVPDTASTSTVLNIAVEESLDVRGSRLFLRGDGLVLEGELLQNPETVISNSALARPTLVVRNGRLTRMDGRVLAVSLRAEGTGTELRLNASTWVQNTGALSAADGGKLLVEPGATLTGDYGLSIAGNERGVVEFAEGFQLVDFGQREPEPGLNGLRIMDGVTWVTNGSENLPNLDPAQMLQEVDYFGRIDLAWPNTTWRVASNAQSYNQRLNVLTSTNLVTDADLTFEPESMISFGSRDFRLQNDYRLLSGTVLSKSGAADLRLFGRLSAIHGNAIDVRQGRLVMKNHTVEGAGSLDIRIGSGATLSGGNVAGTAGWIPGAIHAQARGTVDPGDGEETGILSVVGDNAALVLATDSIYRPTLRGTVAGTSYDQIRVAGSVELGDEDAGGAAVLAPVLDYAPTLGDLQFVIDNDGLDAIAGLFKTTDGGPLAQGAMFDVVSAADGQAYRFAIGYTGDAPSASFSIPGKTPLGNDLVLRNVPIGPGWTSDADGAWSDEGNWTPHVPNAAGEEAYFGPVITAPRTVSVDVPVTVGRLSLNSPHAYTLAGPGPITLDVLTGAARVQVAGGSPSIQAPLVLADDLLISIPPVASTLSIVGSLNAAGKTVTKNGVGTLQLDNVRAGALDIESGTVALSPGGGTSVLGALSIDGEATSSARFDLADNPTIVDYIGGSVVTEIRQQLLSGRGGPGFGASWNGPGIMSSTVATLNAAEPEARSIGYAENRTLPLGSYTSFGGVSVDDTSILLAYTRTGDANLDGIIDDDDVTIVSAAYAPGIAQPHWALGDFNYDGFVDDDDVTLLGVFYDPSAAPLIESNHESLSTSVAAVPEPATVLLSIFAVALLAVWRCKVTASSRFARVRQRRM